MSRHFEKRAPGRFPRYRAVRRGNQVPIVFFVNFFRNRMARRNPRRLRGANEKTPATV